MIRILLILGLIVAVSAVLTGWLRRYSLKKAILDIPNARSSHTLPTPRGGGISIVIVFLAAMIGVGLYYSEFLDLVLALSGGTLLVAIVGYCDDLYGVAARWRILVHLLAAGWALYWLNGFPMLNIGIWQIHLGWWGIPLAALGMVWFINLYNFMDGIDGLAGMEAVFASAGAGLLLGLMGSMVLATVCFFLAAATAGFLIWNWPPANIFMGDTGSGTLGYIFGVLLIATANSQVLPPPVWIILLAVFILDATFTLMLRVYRKEPLYQAHRSHAYQQVVIQGRSHLRVTGAVLGINLLVLLPLAWLSLIYPAWTLPILLLLFTAGGLLWYSIIRRNPVL